MRGSQAQMTEDWELYRSLRNRVALQIRRAKYNYNKKIIQDNSDDPKSFWKTMKKILPERMKKNISTAMNIDGRLVSDNVQVANAFNSHFIKSIRSLIDLLGISSRNENNSSSLESLNKSEENSFKFTPVTEQFTVEFLRKCKVRKGTGLDQIPARLLKDSATVISAPLTRIVNASLRTG